MRRQDLPRTGRKQKFVFLLVVAALLLFIFAAAPVLAKVTGECVNCHTMHNSQGAAPMPGAGSISENGQHAALTRGSCVGCHSNTGSETIKVLGSSRIPVVYNTVQPVNELAGGNFYWVKINEENGHNVLTIPGIVQDTKLSVAPASPVAANGGCDGCHAKTADCTSCHSPYHHGEGAKPVVGSDAQSNGDSIKSVYYRFLANGSYFHTAGGVMGIEDPDWEQTRSATKHNVYAGGSIPAVNSSGLINDDGSMSNYCAGCHTKFHSKVDSGSASPWLRHPNNYALPADASKEYRLYNSQDGTNVGPYNPEAPVARPDILVFNGAPNLVRPGTDQVFCLSCHKPHGSPNKDILRWDYAGMIAGTAGPTAKTGCFICHTTKDGN